VISPKNLLKFDENFYLEKHQSVRAAISIGRYASGYHHYLVRGRDEGNEARFVRLKEPLVTVVVPCYNMDKFVFHTLLSVSIQSYRNIECIVVDDCSSDTSAQIVSVVSKNDKRFKLIRHKTNQGLSASRNTGLCNASGDLVTFLDADDILFQNSIRDRVTALLENAAPEVIGAYCGSVHIAESFDSIPESKTTPRRDVADYLSSQGKCPFTANQPLMFTSLLKAMGGFDEGLRQAEDWDFWNRIVRHGYEFVPTNCNAVGYRQRAGSMIRSAPLFHLETGLKILDRFYESATDRLNFNTPFFYHEKLQSYLKQDTVAERVVAAIGMAGETDADTIEKCVESFIPDVAAPAIRRRLDIRDSLAKGIARAEGMKAGERDRIKSRDEVYLARTEATILNKSESLIEARKQEGFARRKEHFVFHITKARNISKAMVVAVALGKSKDIADKYLIDFILPENLKNREAYKENLENSGFGAHTERQVVLGLVKPAVFVTDTEQGFGKMAAQAVFLSGGFSVFWELMGRPVDLPDDTFSVKLSADPKTGARSGAKNALAEELCRIDSAADRETQRVKLFPGGRSVRSALAIVSFDEEQRTFRSDWIDAVNNICLMASVEHRFWQSDGDASVIPPIKSVDGKLPEIAGKFDIVICRNHSDLLLVSGLANEVVCFDPTNELDDENVFQNASDLIKALTDERAQHGKGLLHLQTFEPLISEEAIAGALAKSVLVSQNVATNAFLEIVQETYLKQVAGRLEEVSVTGPVEKTVKEMVQDILTKSPIAMPEENCFVAIFNGQLKASISGKRKSDTRKIARYVDRKLEIFYHSTKNLPLFGRLVRIASRIYDSIFKK